MRNIIKILIVGLMLIASGNVYSGSKEYTLKHCDEGIKNCDECKGDGSKVSFKVSKSLGSVMQTVIQKDGTSGSSTIDNCKIFDEDTFECELISEPYLYKDRSSDGMSSRKILSNGKFESIHWEGEKMMDGKWYKETSTYNYCATEIKSIYNLFK